MKNRVGTRDNERAAVKAVKSVLFASAAALAVQAAVLPQPALAQSYTFTEVSIEGSQRIEPATILKKFMPATPVPMLIKTSPLLF